MKVKQLFSRRKPAVQGLYAAIVAAARQPCLYGLQGAADTIDGRLAMIMLHLIAVLVRLRQLGAAAESQQLVEVFFADVEGNLREQGISDVAIPKRMREIEALYVARAERMSQFETADEMDLPCLLAAAVQLSDAAEEPFSAEIGRQFAGLRARLANHSLDAILAAQGVMR